LRGLRAGGGFVVACVEGAELDQVGAHRLLLQLGEERLDGRGELGAVWVDDLADRRGANGGFWGVGGGGYVYEVDTFLGGGISCDFWGLFV
jgi:hypothetical protein